MKLFGTSFEKSTQTILLLSFLCLTSSCDGTMEFVVNCNNNSVFSGKNLDDEIKPYSKFSTFVGGSSAKGDKFRYPDGSVRGPKIVNPVDVYKFDPNFGSNDLTKTKSLCRKFGPGVLVIG